MIVFGVGVLLARPSFALGGLALSPAWVVLRARRGLVPDPRQPRARLAVSACVGVLILLAHQVAYGSVAGWLAWGVGVFFVAG